MGTTRITNTLLDTRSANLAGTALDNKANLSSSDPILFDNSTGKHITGLVTVVLNTITPTTNGSITLRVFYSDGVITEDTVTRSGYSEFLSSGASVKNTIFEVMLKPCLMKFIVVNNSGTTFQSSGNAFYVTTYDEEGNG